MKLSRKILIQYGGVLFIFSLALGTVYFTSQGLDFYKGVRDSLGDYGAVEAFKGVALDGKEVTADSLRQKVVLTAFLQPEQKASLDLLEALHEQFRGEQDLELLLFLSADSPSIENRWKQLLEKHPLGQENTATLIAETPDRFTARAHNSFGLRDHCPGLPSDPCDYLVLSDTATVIRAYTSGGDEEAVKQLVRQAYFLLPKEKKKKPRLKREKEK